jgi:adenine-specific DNA-methyltransferase
MRERLDDALKLLAQVGMPPAQQNDRTAYVLLALLDLGPEQRWIDADGGRRWRTVEMMQWMRDRYGKDYAANSRETIRRFSLHQLVDAGLAVYNPDKPDRAVNSPDACYQITPEALALAREFGKDTWDVALADFLKAKPGLVERYAKARTLAHVPITVPEGELLLSPGAHSELIRSIVETFGPRFVPGGVLLYAGDTGDKHGYFNREALAALGVTVDDHGKLPDVVLHDVQREWLVLAEAASSHGPVDGKRHGELSKLFAAAKVPLVYVSAFPDRGTMRKYLEVLAWETEVWVADAPDHLIHFNGDRYLGPHADSDRTPKHS